MLNQSMYHVHVDAVELSISFANHLTQNLGFSESDFAGHPEGSEGYEPVHHFTRKPSSGLEFRRLFAAVSHAAAQPGALVGYIEGEYLPYDIDLVDKPFQPEVMTPVEQIALCSLPRGSFRESEIHIVMHADKSDPRLLKYLSSIGLFSAYMNKAYGRAIVFTAGGDHRTIGKLGHELITYLNAAGGTSSASVKEERIIGYWLSAESLRLPPVVERVSWVSEVHS